MMSRMLTVMFLILNNIETIIFRLNLQVNIMLIKIAPFIIPWVKVAGHLMLNFNYSKTSRFSITSI
jgi:hypothetical protein